jgi:hypothetical protein
LFVLIAFVSFSQSVYPIKDLTVGVWSNQKGEMVWDKPITYAEGFKVIMQNKKFIVTDKAQSTYTIVDVVKVDEEKDMYRSVLWKALDESGIECKVLLNNITVDHVEEVYFTVLYEKTAFQYHLDFKKRYEL